MKIEAAGRQKFQTVLGSRIISRQGDTYKCSREKRTSSLAAINEGARGRLVKIHRAAAISSPKQSFPRPRQGRFLQSHYYLELTCCPVWRKTFRRSAWSSASAGFSFTCGLLGVVKNAAPRFGGFIPSLPARDCEFVRWDLLGSGISRFSHTHARKINFNVFATYVLAARSSA